VAEPASARACGLGLAPLLGAVALLGCPGDPAFVAGDTDDGQATTTSTDATSGGDADTSDNDADSDADTSDDGAEATEVEVVTGPACPPPCGPVASCEDGVCVCDQVACADAVAETGVDDVALVMLADNTPAIAYARVRDLPDLVLSRWQGSGWRIDDTITRVYDTAIGATRTADGTIVLLGDGEAGTVALHWEPGEDGPWLQGDTNLTQCRHAAIGYDPTRPAVLAGCTDPSSAIFTVSVQQRADGEMASLPPLSVGKPGNNHLVRWVVDTSGRVWLAFSEAKPPDVSLHVRVYDSAWSSEELGSATPPAATSAGPPLDIALDGVDRPHVAYLRSVSDTATLTLRSRVDIDNWVSHDLDPGVALADVTRLDLEPGAGAGVQLLLVRGSSLVWVQVADGVVVASRTLDVPQGVSASDLVTDGHGKPWVAYGRGLADVSLWRPDGP